MQSHVILNNFIVDTNPLKLGYIEIWGVGSVSISNVTISVRNVDIPLPVSYNPTTQVCFRWKSNGVLPTCHAQCLLPLCMIPFPEKPFKISTGS